MKLGAHCLGGSADARRLLEQTETTVLKCVDGYGMADHAKLHVLTIGRKYEPWFDANRLRQEQSPEYAAAQYVAFMEADIRAAPRIKAWEGPNEQAPNSALSFDWFARFEAERARILRERFGLAAVVGNFSTGTPDLPEADRFMYWRLLEPMLEAARRYGGYLGLHEYWYVDEQGGPVQANWITWLPLRYRWVLQYMGPKVVPIVITECGWDALPMNPPGLPFRKSGLSAQAYVNSLAWYDQELRRDPAVVGAVVFTFGSGWEAQGHNVEGRGVTDLLIQYAKDHPMIASVPVSVSDPSPKRIRLKPNAGGWWNVRHQPNLSPNSVASQLPAGGEFSVIREHGEFYQIGRSGTYQGKVFAALFVHQSAVEVLP